MKIIYCQDPVFEHEADSMFIDELAAASLAGLGFELINYDALTENNNAARAVRDIAVRPLESAIYRGWMLSAEQYSALYDALFSRGLQLINNANQYRYTQHLPNSLPLIKAHSPRSVYMATDGKRLSYPAIMQLLIPFAGMPLFLRDYAKSEKYYWAQAAFIPSASDASAVQTLVSRFLQLRGKQLEGGLVFREYVEFKTVAENSADNMPMIKEYRLFFLDGKALTSLHYWQAEGQVEDDAPPPNLFADIARQVQSRFFTIDVAQTNQGDWMIIDLGDGQVASLPTDHDLDAIYRAFAEINS